ncbi:MAG: ComEC/Rec2 family competence protein [Terriglobales bacterium]
MKRSLLIFLLVLVAWAAACAQEFPAWTPGFLDIHQISTGRGNAAFLEFPDGTTLLLDAGAFGDGLSFPNLDPRPNRSRRPGEWIARYIQHMLLGHPLQLDYALLTHFHVDHMGSPTEASPPSRSGAFKLSGITEVGDLIPVRTLIDRGENYLPPPNDDTLRNYHAFVQEYVSKGMQRQTIEVGKTSQIVPTRQPGKYPLEVRAVAANGQVWTGKGEEARSIFPPLASVAPMDRPSENMCSIGLLIRYGSFIFFAGGDMPGIPDAGAPAWHSVESAVAEVIGPVDVHVANHHGSINPESPPFLAKLRSPVMILPAWSPTHPSQDALQRMLSPRLYPGPHDIFVTYLRPPTQASIGNRAKQVKADHGHIVVRVSPGGDTYNVFVLDDTTESFRVLATFGPYHSMAKSAPKP